MILKTVTLCLVYLVNPLIWLNNRKKTGPLDASAFTLVG